MKKLIVYTTLFLIACVFFYACKKELSCEACIDGNKPPIANAGRDTTLILPRDSVMLDGSASSDPDGTITTYKWVKIAGPVSANIANVALSKTTVKSLTAGVYQFELTVNDNGGLSARDTVTVMVDAPGNQPPVACAGADQIITLPANIVTLDGSCSTDPDHNITTYEWTKISGPAGTIATPNTVQTQVTGLVQGVYQFELKVTDAGLLTARDSMQVIVQHPAVSSNACNDVNRPAIPAQLIPIGKLSKTRTDLAVAAAGTKILFAGGAWTLECPECWGSPQVDIYDTVTKSWSTAKLSAGRWGITAIAAGNKIFFAGGEYGDGALDTYYKNIDVYDVLTNSWSVEYLSETRSQVGAAVLGDKIFFAGGEKNPLYECSNVVDIYDHITGDLSTKTLSIQRAFLSAVSVGNKVYFAGGTVENRGYSTSNTIDIFDNSTNSWTTSTLAVHKGPVGGTALNNNVYWSSGCPVEIRNAITGASKMRSLSHAAGSVDPVVIDNKVIFISSGDKFDIYDPANDRWTVGLLPRSITLNGNVISINNTIYLTDGEQVYKLQF